jgi:hypothetical protein
MAKAARVRPKLEPLKLSCTRSDCENELHCFRESKKLAKHTSGSCQACGAVLINWKRVKKLDLEDVAHTFESLKKEWIRHHFWHKEINQHDQNYALRKGRSGMREAAEKRIRTSVAVKTYRDGFQTPWTGNILYYAQHATACCCRPCIEYWHGIPQDQPLTDKQVSYFTEICLLYLFEQMPDLPEYGQKVSPIRKIGKEGSE